jgi:hypothetical protein
MMTNSAVSLVVECRRVRVEAMSLYRAITVGGRMETCSELTGRRRLAALNTVDFIVIFLLSMWCGMR